MYDWSEEKDRQLREDRGIGFEDIIFHIQEGDVLHTAVHPNRQKYPNQKILYVRVDEYVYLVPFVENEDNKFLKTIIPSRKATKKLIRREENEL